MSTASAYGLAEARSPPRAPSRTEAWRRSHTERPGLDNRAAPVSLSGTLSNDAEAGVVAVPAEGVNVVCRRVPGLRDARTPKAADVPADVVPDAPREPAL